MLDLLSDGEMVCCHLDAALPIRRWHKLVPLRLSSSPCFTASGLCSDVFGMTRYPQRRRHTGQCHTAGFGYGGNISTTGVRKLSTRLTSAMVQWYGLARPSSLLVRWKADWT